MLLHMTFESCSLSCKMLRSERVCHDSSFHESTPSELPLLLQRVCISTHSSSSVSRLLAGPSPGPSTAQSAMRPWAFLQLAPFESNGGASLGRHELSALFRTVDAAVLERQASYMTR
jgi:hypothetical protein